MYFKNYSPSSKVWIFQSNQPFTPSQKNKINTALEDFINNWQTHEDSLISNFEIVFDFFILICVDANYTNASGCSTDKLNQAILGIENELNIRLFERTNIAFLINNSITIVKLTDIQKSFDNKSFNFDSDFFDISISTLADLNNNWLKKVKNSWIEKRITV